MESLQKEIVQKQVSNIGEYHFIENKLKTYTEKYFSTFVIRRKNYFKKRILNLIDPLKYEFRQSQFHFFLAEDQFFKRCYRYVYQGYKVEWEQDINGRSCCLKVLFSDLDEIQVIDEIKKELGIDPENEIIGYNRSFQEVIIQQYVDQRLRWDSQLDFRVPQVAQTFYNEFLKKIEYFKTKQILFNYIISTTYINDLKYINQLANDQNVQYQNIELEAPYPNRYSQQFSEYFSSFYDRFEQPPDDGMERDSIYEMQGEFSTSQVVNQHRNNFTQDSLTDYERELFSDNMTDFIESSHSLDAEQEQLDSSNNLDAEQENLN